MFKKGSCGEFLFLFCLGTIFLLPWTASAARLYFEPASGGYGKGDVFKVEIKLDTEGETVNAVKVVAAFPKEFLEVVRVDKTNSFISLWLADPFYSNKEGLVSFAGGLPTPGYHGTGGTVGVIMFRAKEARGLTFLKYLYQFIINQSPIQIVFYKNSMAILNDGKGTPAELKLEDGGYHLIFSQKIKYFIVTISLLIMATLFWLIRTLRAAIVAS